MIIETGHGAVFTPLVQGTMGCENRAPRDVRVSDSGAIEPDAYPMILSARPLSTWTAVRGKPENLRDKVHEYGARSYHAAIGYLDSILAAFLHNKPAGPHPTLSPKEAQPDVPGANPYRPLDEAFVRSVSLAGEQGQTLLAGGEDLEDQALLAWEEVKKGKKVLYLQGKLRSEAEKKLKEALSSVLPGKNLPSPKGWNGIDVKPLPFCTYLHIALSPELAVQYVPGNEANPYSAGGLVRFTLSDYKGDHKQILEALNLAEARLGLDLHLSTGTDLEYLYLRKMIWSKNLENDEFMSLLASERDVSQKRDLCKGYLESNLGVKDLRKLPDYDWKPHFDSPYPPQEGIREAGWPHWIRFDAKEPLRNALKDFYVGAFLSIHEKDKGDGIARIIQRSGALLSTEERWDRLGIYTRGISSEADRSKGGASYAFGRLTQNRELYTFVFSNELLARAEHIVYPHGIYGDTHSEFLKRKREMAEYGTTLNYEFMTKRGIPFLDFLVAINVDNEQDKAKIVGAFHEKGIVQIRGVQVEDIVKVRNKPLWVSLLSPLVSRVI